MPRMALWLGLSGLVIALDQLSKLWILSAFRLGRSVEVTPFFNLVLVYNPGAAFSFLSDAAGWQRWFFIGLALAISVWLVMLIRFHAAERLLPLAASLILGGALGNVIDRVLYGAVVDFLDVHAAGYHWPAFNVADSAITLGVVLLVWQQVFGHHPAARG
ncbi:MAG: signal peptidase II [Rhodocyclaceae bacterium]|nr:signal peptidase II [Rhodocyclaceae bacterium]